MWEKCQKSVSFCAIPYHSALEMGRNFRLPAAFFRVLAFFEQYLVASGTALCCCVPLHPSYRVRSAGRAGGGHVGLESMIKGHHLGWEGASVIRFPELICMGEQDKRRTRDSVNLSTSFTSGDGRRVGYPPEVNEVTAPPSVKRSRPRRGRWPGDTVPRR